jgi:acyl-CoA synthetase (AMP-forming)/AMP-acid ligase II
MSISQYASLTPDKPAVIVGDTGEVLTFGQLEERSRRLANLLRNHGFAAGDRIGILLENGPGFLVAVWAARRAGLLYIPINWHLTEAESAHILANSDAVGLITSARHVELARRSVAGAPLVRSVFAFGPQRAGSISIEDALPRQSLAEPEKLIDGSAMFYSSGTTGVPKGIVPAATGRSFHSLSPAELLLRDLHQVGPDSVVLTAGPLYHAAPLSWAMCPHALGATTVAMQRFDPLRLMEIIARYRVTHCQLVPIHFVRLLKLPAEERKRADVSSLVRVLHAGAPCAVEVKEQMLAWWGPIIHEYYGSSEGLAYCGVTPQEWLSHKGTVGRAVYGGPIHILDEDGRELPAGEIGNVYFENPRPFRYYKDADKTAACFNERGWASLGDMGWLDEDGYLYLADRRSNMIISGGVNIYPQEVEAVLQLHPAVADVAVIGIPDEEFGEQVKAVIELAPGFLASAQLAAEIRRHAREQLAGFKTPKSIDFVSHLRRTPAGKLLRREVRAAYWSDSRVRI